MSVTSTELKEINDLAESLQIGAYVLSEDDDEVLSKGRSPSISTVSEDTLSSDESDKDKLSKKEAEDEVEVFNVEEGIKDGLAFLETLEVEDENDKTVLQTLITEMKKIIDQTNVENEALKDEIDEKKVHIQDFQASSADWEQKLETERAIIKEKDEEILGLHKHLDKSHTREQDYQQEIDAMRTRIVNLEKELEIKRAEVADHNDELGLTAKSKEAFIREIQKLHKEISELNYTNERLKDKYDQDEENFRVVADKFEFQQEHLKRKDEFLMLSEKKKKVAEMKLEKMIAVNNKMKTIIRNGYVNFKRAIKELTLMDKENFKLKKKLNTLAVYCQKLKGYVLEMDDRLFLIYQNHETVVKDYKDLQQEYVNFQSEIKQIRTDSVGYGAGIELNLKRIEQSEKQRRALAAERDELKIVCNTKTKIVAAKDFEMTTLVRKLNDVNREKEVCNKHLLQATEVADDQKKQMESQWMLIRQLELDRETLAREAHRQRQQLTSLLKDKERSFQYNLKLTNQLAEAEAEIQLKKSQNLDVKRDLSKKEEDFKELQAIFKEVYSERNHIKIKLNEAKDEMQYQKNKDKMIQHQIEQLKEAISNKEQQLAKTEILMRRTRAGKDMMYVDLKKTAVRNETLQRNLEEQNKTILRLNSLFDKGEKKKKIMEKYIDGMRHDTGVLKTQLERRNAELSLLYEKVGIMNSILGKGEEQYSQRLDDIRLLKIEVKKLRGEKTMLIKTVENTADLRLEVYHLSRDLAKERQKCLALEEQMESPLNVHRWRLLEGTDPEKKDLIDKTQVLQKKIMKIEQEKSLTEARCSNIEDLYCRMKMMIKKMPGLEITEILEETKRALREKVTENKVLVGKLSAYQNEINGQNLKLAASKKEVDDIKHKYYDLKRQEDTARMKLYEMQQMSRIPIPPPKTYPGGFRSEAIRPCPTKGNSREDNK